jgi:hypothetical protein
MDWQSEIYQVYVTSFFWGGNLPCEPPTIIKMLWICSIKSHHQNLSLLFLTGTICYKWELEYARVPAHGLTLKCQGRVRSSFLLFSFLFYCFKKNCLIILWAREREGGGPSWWKPTRPRPTRHHHQGGNRKCRIWVKTPVPHSRLSFFFGRHPVLLQGTAVLLSRFTIKRQRQKALCHTSPGINSVDWMEGERRAVPTYRSATR